MSLPTISGDRGLDHEEPLIFEIGRQGHCGVDLLRMDIVCPVMAELFEDGGGLIGCGWGGLVGRLTQSCRTSEREQ